MNISCAEKAFFIKRRDFSSISYKVKQYFNSGHAHKPKLGLFFFLPLTVLNFVCCPFSFCFSRPFYTGYLFRYMFFLAAVKSWMLITGEVKKWTLITHRRSGPFYHRFCTKTDNVVFRFATSECHRRLNLTIVRKGLA